MAEGLEPPDWTNDEQAAEHVHVTLRVVCARMVGAPDKYWRALLQAIDRERPDDVPDIKPVTIKALARAMTHG